MLQGRAEALAKSGYVTDENIDLIVSLEKETLQLLQRESDRRVSSALDKQRKQWDEESAKKAAEAEAAKKAEEEAAKKAAEEEAKKKADEESKRLADEAAKKKAAEDAEAQKKAAEEFAALEAKKNIPEDFLNYFKAEKERAAVERMEFQNQLAQLMEERKKESETYKSMIDSLVNANTELKTNFETLKDGYNTLNSENEANKLAAKTKAREDFILNKAKELGIPEWRVAEGFRITDEMDENAISDILSTTANNIKTQMLPQGQPSYSMSGAKATKEEAGAIADMLLRHI